MSNTRLKIIGGLLVPVLISGCSQPIVKNEPISKTHDIEAECWKDDGAFMGVFEAPIDETNTINCYAPEFFGIQCKASTVQHIGQDILCSTHDGQSVKITQYKPSQKQIDDRMDENLKTVP